IIGATAWNPIFGGNLVLANDLTIASNNASGSTLTFNGGVTGTGNITVSIGNTSNASLVTFGAAEVNNAGTLTYNNAAVTIGSTAGVAGSGTGTNLITGGVGSNVTAITQASNSNALTIQTNALTVNSGGTTLNATGTAKLTVSGGVAGTGNLILNTNHNSASNGITLSGAAVNNLGTITNSGTGTAGTVISSTIDYNVSGVIQNSATSSLTLSGVNYYTGATTVTSGSMIINGTVASSSVVVDGSLSGTGTMTNATLSGSGAIHPGNGAGIMTAALIDPTDGLDFNFEFTAANTLPTWSAPTASVNDVLRLTDLFNPIVVPMNGTNLISLYLNVASLTVGNMFTGGFYTDKNASFQTAIAGANYQYYLANANGAITYNGNKYDLYTGLLAFTVSTVQQTANFSNPSSTGYVTRFTVINGPYLQWAGGGGAFSSDDNGDGVANGLAWLLGASGPNVNARSKLPTLTTSSGDIHLNFSVLNSSSRGYATIKVQYSKDMGVTDSWTSHEAAVPDVTSTVNGVSFIVIPNGNSNNVEAVIPASAAGTGKKLFTRLVSNMP
ncbi:MAG TPA: hypothetical protein VFY13_01455, partial [Luteolibacter sp.]|nr:hypothetical protein [Luteolibacter sp.]